MKLGLVIKEYHDLDIVVHCTRVFIGSFERISTRMSFGR